MRVEILDREAQRYRCQYGDFQMFPDDLGDAPLPRVAAFSHWSTDDPRLHRRSVDGITYIDVDHAGRTWTYCLDPAWTATPAERVPAYFQLPAGFDIGILPD